MSPTVAAAILAISLSAQVFAAPYICTTCQTSNTHRIYQTHTSSNSDTDNLSQGLENLEDLTQHAESGSNTFHDDQLTLDNARPGNWTDVNHYRTPDGHGQVYEEQGQHVQGPTRVRFYRKNFTSSYSSGNSGGLEVPDLSGFDSYNRRDGSDLGSQQSSSVQQSTLERVRSQGSSGQRGNSAYHRTTSHGNLYGSQGALDSTEGSSSYTGGSSSHFRADESALDSQSRQQGVLDVDQQRPRNWSSVNTYRTDGGNGRVYEEQGQFAAGPTQVRYFRKNYTSSFNSGGAVPTIDATLVGQRDFEGMVEQLRRQFDSQGREIHRTTQGPANNGYFQHEEHYRRTGTPIDQTNQRVIPSNYESQNRDTSGAHSQRTYEFRHGHDFDRHHDHGFGHDHRHSHDFGLDHRHNHEEVQSSSTSGVVRPGATGYHSHRHSTGGYSGTSDCDSDETQQVLSVGETEAVRPFDLQSGSRYGHSSQSQESGNRRVWGSPGWNQDQTSTSHFNREYTSQNAGSHGSVVQPGGFHHYEQFQTSSGSRLPDVDRRYLGFDDNGRSSSTNYRIKSGDLTTQGLDLGQIAQDANAMRGGHSYHQFHQERFYRQAFRPEDHFQQTENLNQQTQDLTQQTEDLTQQTEDLTQQTEDLTQQTQHFTQHGQDLTQQTEDLTQQTEDLTQQTVDLTQQTEDLTQQTEDLTQQTEDLTQQTVDLTQQTEDLTQQTQDFTQQSQDLTQQTEDLTQQTQDFTQQSQDLTQQTQDLTQQSQDLTQQTEDLTQQTQDFTQQSQDLIQQTEDLTQQTQDLTQQTEDLSQRTQGGIQQGFQQDDWRIAHHDDQIGYSDYAPYVQNPPQSPYDKIITSGERGVGDQQTQDLFQQTEDLTQQTEDLTQQTEDLTQQTQDFSQDLTQQTEDLTQQTEDLTQQTQGFPQEGQDLTQQTEDLTQQTEDLTQQTEDLTQQTEDFSQDLTQQTEDLTQQTEDLTQQTEDLTQQTQGFYQGLTQQTEDLTQQTEDLTQQTEDLTQQTQGFPQHGQDLTQQTEDLTQQTEDLTQQMQGFPQQGQDLTQRTEDLTQQTEDLTQQTEDLTQQTQDFYQDLTQQTEDLTQQTEDLTQQTEDLTQQTEDLTQQTQGFPQEGQDLTQQTEDLTQQTEDLTQQTEDLTQQTEDLTQQTQDFYQDLTQQTEDLTQQTEDLTQQTQGFPQQGQDLTQQTEDLTQQNEDLTQQTEDLTQQTEDLTQQTEDLTQQTEDLTQQTEDLTQQTEDLTQQTEDLSQQSGYTEDFTNQRTSTSQFLQQETFKNLEQVARQPSKPAPKPKRIRVRPALFQGPQQINSGQEDTTVLFTDSQPIPSYATQNSQKWETTDNLYQNAREISVSPTSNRGDQSFDINSNEPEYENSFIGTDGETSQVHQHRDYVSNHGTPPVQQSTSENQFRQVQPTKTKTRRRPAHHPLFNGAHSWEGRQEWQPPRDATTSQGPAIRYTDANRNGEHSGNSNFGQAGNTGAIEPEVQQRWVNPAESQPSRLTQVSENTETGDQTVPVIGPRILEAFGGSEPSDRANDPDRYASVKPNPSATFSPNSGDRDSWEIYVPPVPTTTEEGTTIIPITTTSAPTTTTPAPTSPPQPPTPAAGFWNKLGHSITSTYDKAKEKAKEFFG